MTLSASVRVMSPEEIVAQAGGETPFFRWPERSTLFAERQMRLRQLAGGHAMAEFLRFMAELARVQQAALLRIGSVPLPDDAALSRAAEAGLPPLAAADWPRDPAWRVELRRMVAELTAAAPQAVPDGVRTALERVAGASDDALEAQADALLDGVMQGLDLATAPLIAAALQVYWTHLVLSVQAQGAGSNRGPLDSAFGRTDDVSVCPCCGSRPTASLTRSSSGGNPGQRYLHCSLCSTQWYLERIKCAHCLSIKGIAYQSLAAADGDDPASQPAQSAVQAETCDDCGHYLKILHGDRNPFVDPVADDLATLTLDLLVAEAGLQRHGVNLMLLFGQPAASPADPPGPG